MDKNYIQTEKEFLDTLIYWPIASNDGDWERLKWKAQQDSRVQENKQSIGNIAQLLISDINFEQNNTKVKEVRNIYSMKELNFETFKDKGVEACPSEDGLTYYLRDGNKSAIALTMKLLKGEIKFVPVKIVDWEEKFERKSSKELGRSPNRLNASLLFPKSGARGF